MTIPTSLRRLLGASILCGASLAVWADDEVTFQVDMTRYTNSAGAQAATLVDVRGAFNGWNPGWPLVNNGANVYTNTYTVTGAAASTHQYKFTFTTAAGTTWEDNNPPPGAGQPPSAGNNRVLQLVGGTQVLPVVPFYAPSVTPPLDFVTNNVTFRVDMTAQIQISAWSHGQPIRLSGAMTGWGDGVDMTNNPALTGDATNIFSVVRTIAGQVGQPGGQYKFRANNGWENDGVGPGGAQNRNFTVTLNDQVLPVVYYNNVAPQPVTNANVVFQIDMTPQVLSGAFVNGSLDEIRVSGGMNGWGDGTLLTNNPTLNSVASNYYSMTIPVTNVVNQEYFYKFRLWRGGVGGWESAAIYGVGVNLDRHFFLTGGPGGEQVLPMVTYSDASLCDILLQPTTTTFRLHLTNGTPDITGHAFDKMVDTVHINGEFLGWASWNIFDLPQLTNNPIGSDFYEYTHVLPAGSPRAQKFKFGINGGDNEAPQFLDHIQYVRTPNASWTMPAAEFGTNYASLRIEQAFGGLTIGAPAGGNLPINWLTLPCVTLQTRSTVTGGAYTDLPATENTSSTNWPNTGTQQYFRLYKRPLP